MVHYPSFAHEAVLFLLERVKPSMRVFEWGCGDSTSFFAECCGDVNSVEHAADWAERYQDRWPHVAIHLVDVGPGRGKDGTDPDSYVGKMRAHPSRPAKKYVWCRDYAHTIDQVEGKFDIISVDALARAPCIRLAVHRMAPGGLLILDDYAKHYARAAKLVPTSWKRNNFRGLSCKDGRAPVSPAKNIMKTTSVWRVPA